MRKRVVMSSKRPNNPLLESAIGLAVSGVHDLLGVMVWLIVKGRWKVNLASIHPLRATFLLYLLGSPACVGVPNHVVSMCAKKRSRNSCLILAGGSIDGMYSSTMYAIPMIPTIAPAPLVYQVSPMMMDPMKT